jgi:hypothetical protein
MNDEEKQLWKSIVNKCSSDETQFFYGIMNYLQRKAIKQDLYHLYVFADDVKTIIENEALDSIEKNMKEREYTDIDPDEFFN